jgi:hypothetical protein
VLRLRFPFLISLLWAISNRIRTCWHYAMPLLG